MTDMNRIVTDLTSRIGIRWGHKFGDGGCGCGCRPFNPDKERN